MLAGRLIGSVDGQPVQLHAQDDTLAVSLPGVGAAWRLRGTWPELRRLVTAAGTIYGVCIVVHIPLLPKVTLSPAPNWWARIFLPG